MKIKKLYAGDETVRRRVARVANPGYKRLGKGRDCREVRAGVHRFFRALLPITLPFSGISDRYRLPILVLASNRDARRAPSGTEVLTDAAACA